MLLGRLSEATQDRFETGFIYSRHFASFHPALLSVEQTRGKEGRGWGDDSSGGNVGGKVNRACELPRAAQDQERSILSVSVTGQIFTKLGL